MTVLQPLEFCDCSEKRHTTCDRDHTMFGIAQITWGVEIAGPSTTIIQSTQEQPAKQ